jgi:P pilus assembly protein, porin PapC
MTRVPTRNDTMPYPNRSPRRRSAAYPVRRPLALALAMATSGGAWAAVDPAGPQAAFASDFLHTAGPVDLSRFERGNVVLAGVYRPQVRVNNQPVGGIREVTFQHVADSESAAPCFDRTMLLRLGVSMEKLEAARAPDAPKGALGDAPFCGALSATIPGASADFDDGEQVLGLSIPQAFLASQARGYVSPDQWDAGDDAAMLNYNASAFHVRRDGERSTASHVNLRAGLNAGGWRLRHAGSFSVADHQRRWMNTQTFAQHDLTEARAQMTLGDAYTSGLILDSVRLRGVSIASDPRMLPASQRGYAPVVRGVAESNAQVTVRQNGYVIHSTTVAPGAFEIDDLYPTGYGSDLIVTITEADGRERTFLVPYTAVPQMLREGTSLFAISAGQVAEQSLRETPFVFQATWQRGVSANTTLYAGTTASNSYWAGLAGGAVNLPFGAIALDVTSSRAAFRTAGIKRGQSVRLRFNRVLATSGTNLGVAAYRFSSRDYLGVVDAARLRADLNHTVSAPRPGGERSRFDATVGQRIGAGQLSATGSLVDYWDRRSRSVNYTVGYGNTWRRINYNVSVQRSRLGDVLGGGHAVRRQGVTDTTIYLSLSVPLGAAPSAPMLSTTYNRSSQGGHAATASLGGLLDADGNLAYNVAANRMVNDGRASSAGSASLGYRTPAGQWRAGVGQSRGGTSQYSLSATGAVVGHRHGITFAQELGETNAILHAPGAAGARVEAAAGVRLDRHGNAVVRGLMPYQLNTVGIDPRGASLDVRLASTSHIVAPRAGAFIGVDYDTSVAAAVLILATRDDGEPLPFGASVTDGGGQPVGVVGQGGKIFTRGVQPGSRISVRWGDGSLDHCEIDVPAELDALPRHGQHRAMRTGCVVGTSFATTEEAT